MKTRKTVNNITVLTLVFLLTISFYASTTSNATPLQTTQIFNTQPLDLPPGETNMTFTSGITMDLTTGMTILMRTGIKMQFAPQDPQNPFIFPCFYGMNVGFPWPAQLVPCSWWELLDPNGFPTGIEFHVDYADPMMFHIDIILPGPFPIGGWPLPLTAELKIQYIEPCTELTVVDIGTTPEPCSWWEITYPGYEGYEFHVDYSNPQDGTFHIDQITPGPIFFPEPPPYELHAERKITTVSQCTELKYVSPSGYQPAPCDWWEIISPVELRGTEMHIDHVSGDLIHIDMVVPAPILGIAVYKITVEKKIPTINLCDWFPVARPSPWAPDVNTWWRIIAPASWIGVTFHVDQNTSTTFHVDQINGQLSVIVPPPYKVVAEPYNPTPIHDVAVTAVSPLLASVILGCPDIIDVTVENQGDFAETFVVSVTYGTNPVTTSPITISGLGAHSSQIIRFWWITTGVPVAIYSIAAAASIVPGETDTADNTLVDGTISVTNPPFQLAGFYWKRGYADYAPCGIPDFDERQDNWMNGQTWTWCAPVAVANSLWWLDSEFEPANPPVAPPTINDGFPLVSAYTQGIDDHDSANVQPFIQHLAYLMDTDGQRTHIVHTGTNTVDLEAGLAQYLSWTGVNPLGDVNGDGIVNAVDVSIVTAAMGSSPGMAGWNMAADISPITSGWPIVGMADNIINAQDLSLVNSHLGQKGLFERHTVNNPALSYIEGELRKCQDVVLQLGYWIWTGSSWYRENGHFVTIAGIDGALSKVAISDPIHDAFEGGLIAQGRIPIPHVHVGPEPPYTTHNNAAYVSQDIYDVVAIPTGQYPVPCPGGSLYLQNFPGWIPTPPCYTVIEAAIMTSPLGVHDVAVTNLQRLKTIVGKGYICKLNLTVQNQGDFTETFNVTVSAATMPPSAQACKTTILNLLAHETRTVTMVWDTSQWAYGNYTTSATADTVPSETDTADNTFNDSWVKVTIPGDTNGDQVVNVLDLILIATHLGHINGDGHTPFTLDWYKCMNTDVQGDNVHNVLDLILCASHLGQHWP